MSYGDSAAYARRAAWINRGRPFSLITPLQHLAEKLRGYGYTVYGIGNDEHLLSDPPEDHTPYSGTGWPGKATYGKGYAIDIMPPNKAGLPSLQQLGAQLVSDRNANVPGVSWLKYMNWEPQANYSGPCYQDGWTPNHYRVASGDRGHIHISARTGMDNSTIAADYDPVARLRGGGTGGGTPDNGEDEDMAEANDLAKWMSTPSGTKGQKFVPAKGSPAFDLENLRKLADIDGRTARLESAMAAVLSAVGKDNVDEAQIATLVLAGLTGDKLAGALKGAGLTADVIAAGIPKDLAAQVAQKLADRLAA